MTITLVVVVFTFVSVEWLRNYSETSSYNNVSIFLRNLDYFSSISPCKHNRWNSMHLMRVSCWSERLYCYVTYKGGPPIISRVGCLITALCIVSRYYSHIVCRSVCLSLHSVTYVMAALKLGCLCSLYRHTSVWLGATLYIRWLLGPLNLFQYYIHVRVL